MIELKNLYGGAICAYVPSDACDIRQFFIQNYSFVY